MNTPRALVLQCKELAYPLMHLWAHQHQDLLPYLHPDPNLANLRPTIHNFTRAMARLAFFRGALLPHAASLALFAITLAADTTTAFFYKQS